MPGPPSTAMHPCWDWEGGSREWIWGPTRRLLLQPKPEMLEVGSEVADQQMGLKGGLEVQT